MVKAPATAGYASPSYAACLSELGRPRALPGSGGWVLERSIPNSSLVEGMGCYPFFACADWSRLEADLSALSDDLVSLVLVTDPFGSFSSSDLEECFPDHLVPFKEHFVVGLEKPPALIASTHHQRNARKALSVVDVETGCRPDQVADDWAGLYANLVLRHRIRGFAAFSASSLRQQLQVPGLVVLRARAAGETVGITLWYVRDDVAYYHLGAYSDAGYRMRASYALFWRAIEHFRERGLRWLSLGAGAGAEPKVGDGLARFKHGWATSSRTVYLAGRVFDRERYRALAVAAGGRSAGWFPAYRAPEGG
jgi:GNAT acetyltransferase-like protein